MNIITNDLSNTIISDKEDKKSKRVIIVRN